MFWEFLLVCVVLPIFLLILFTYPLLFIIPFLLYGGLWGGLALVKAIWFREDK